MKRALGLAALLLTSIPPDLKSGNYDSSTFYPSPSGIYTTLSTTGNTYLATQGGNVGIFTTAPGANPAATGQAAASPQSSRYMDVNGIIQTDAGRFAVNGFDEQGNFWFKTLSGTTQSSGENGSIFLGTHNSADGGGIDIVYLVAENGLPPRFNYGISLVAPTVWDPTTIAFRTTEDAVMLGRFPFGDAGNSPLNPSVPRLQSFGEFSGQVLTADNALQVDGSNRGIDDTGNYGYLIKGTNGNLYAALFFGGVHIAGKLDVSGEITSYATSDARLKKNIKPISGALGKISRLRPVRFEWKDDVAAERHWDRGTQWGLVAQDVEKVLPELVSEDSDGFKRVRYGQEIGMLELAAIRELKAGDDFQRARLDEAGLELDQLRTEMKALEKKRP